MKNLSEMSDRIRVFDSVDLEPILNYASQYGLKVSVEVSMSGDIKQKISKILAFEREYPNTIDSIIVGNNEIHDGNMSVKNLMAYINFVQLNTDLPVTSLNNHDVWLKNPELANSVDFIMVDYFTMFETDSPVEAVKLIAQKYDMLDSSYPFKQIVFETGWPHACHGTVCSSCMVLGNHCHYGNHVNLQEKEMIFV